MSEDARLALRELADAWRGDWHDFDGRTLKHQLRAVEQVADGEMTLAQFRDDSGLCPKGGGHWTEYCERYDDNPGAF